MKLSLLKFIARVIGLYETNPFDKQEPFAELIKRLMNKERCRYNPLFKGGPPCWEKMQCPIATADGKSIALLGKV